MRERFACKFCALQLVFLAAVVVASQAFTSSALGLNETAQCGGCGWPFTQACVPDFPGLCFENGMCHNNLNPCCSGCQTSTCTQGCVPETTTCIPCPDEAKCSLNGAKVWDGEHCQDPVAKAQDPSRCWQSNLAKAVAICNRHSDCTGVTRDNNGYEPRGGDPEYSESAHDVWVKNSSSRVTYEVSHEINKNVCDPTEPGGCNVCSACCKQYVTGKACNKCVAELCTAKGYAHRNCDPVANPTA